MSYCKLSVPTRIPHITLEGAPLPSPVNAHITATITALCVGPNLNQYVQDMGDLLFPVDGIPGIGQKTIVDEGTEKGLLNTGDTLLELPSCCEDGDEEDLGSVNSISEESGGSESPSDSDEVAEEAMAGESDALSDHVLDESIDLL